MILLDSGPGSWRNIAVANLPAGALTAVFLTHYHSDHMGGLGEAMTQSWIAGRAQPLEVYGPAGVERVVNGFVEAYALDASYRTEHHTEQYMPSRAARAVAKTIPAGDLSPVFERSGLVVKAFAVPHEPATPAVGYRVEFGGNIVVFTGDAAASPAIAKAAAGADLLLHDALNKGLIRMAAAALGSQGRARQAKMIADTLTYHASPEEAARIAAEAKVKKLVLTHCVPPPNQPAVEQAFLRGLAGIFPGEIVIARDSMKFDLPPRP
ncbi:MAG: MBL fold metallo-hydrolase [Bryobacteraceae bacterium]|nr:MBL fold metallo-hydrolase [Bryobacteraceae bacterium]